LQAVVATSSAGPTFGLVKRAILLEGSAQHHIIDLIAQITTEDAEVI